MHIVPGDSVVSWEIKSTKEIISEGNFPGNKGVSNRNKGGEIRVQLEGNSDLGQMIRYSSGGRLVT